MPVCTPDQIPLYPIWDSQGKVTGFTSNDQLAGYVLRVVCAGCTRTHPHGTCPKMLPQSSQIVGTYAEVPPSGQVEQGQYIADSQRAMPLCLYIARELAAHRKPVVTEKEADRGITRGYQLYHYNPSQTLQ